MLISLEWQAWVTLGIILASLISLFKELARPDVILMGALGLLLLFGILSPSEALSGFSNPAVITVGSLFIVAAGIQNTGALIFTEVFLFHRSTHLSSVLARLMGTTAVLSAFLNNTPIVAMLIPRVKAWSERAGVPASRLMIPLSYAAILGGMTTLIGTSTNLVVSGLMQANGYPPLGVFDLTVVGAPAALCAVAYFVLFGYRFLPDRQQEELSFEKELKSYLFELQVAPGSSLEGQTIEAAGLRSLGEAYLAHLHRDGQILSSSPNTFLQSGDVLTFSGSRHVLNQLLKKPGLMRTTSVRQSESQTTLPLFEAVVAPTSNLIGKTLRETQFREQYQGVVLAIHRRDEQIEAPLGRTPIRAGDLLLIEAQGGFDKRWNEYKDEFYLVAPRGAQKNRPHKKKAPMALLILLAVILLAAVGVAPIATTAFIGALAFIATGCLSADEARKALDLPVLIVIAAALGLGGAVESTGLADTLAWGITESTSLLGPMGILAIVYLVTGLLTEIITNNAAAALMLPIGLSIAQHLGIPPKAFALVVAIAASASFLTPIGYQTNLMVMSPGGYRFSDYLRSGLLVTLIVATTSLAMISWIWL